MTVSRGTIVYAGDPFKDGDAGRPRVIVNTPATPFHGEQYVALTLATKTWHDDGLPIGDDEVIDGTPPEASSILPWAVASIDHGVIENELGRLDEVVVDEAVSALGTYVGVGRERDG